jgi:hypothetical protein
MAHTLIPPTRQRGYAGYPPFYDNAREQTVAFNRRPGAAPGPWGPPTAAPAPIGPWGAPYAGPMPGPWGIPPQGGKDRTSQRWWIAGAGAVAAVAAAVVAVVGFSADHGAQPVATQGVAVPGPAVPSTPAPQIPTPTPTPNSSPSTSTISDSALPSLVPNIATVSRVMGSSGMAPIDKLNGPGLFTDQFDPSECGGAVIPSTQAAYASSAMGSTYVQALHDQDPDGAHSVFNGVTTFPTASSAATFVTQQSVGWQGCQGRPIVMDPDKDKPLTWTVRDVKLRGGTVTANTSLAGAGVLCQRAMTAMRNVVIDVTACNSDDPANTAVTLASMISDRLGHTA